MSTSIQFNGTEINNVTYITENTTHDEAPSRSISAFKIARRDGEKLVSAFWGRKEITITGYIIGSNRADFENQVDLLKSLLSPQSANLDINYNGVYRRYIATAEEIKINRDSFNIDWAPYSAKFLVPLGIGADTSENNISSVASIVSTPYSVTKTFGGSYNPKPRHRVTLVTRGNADVIRIKNTVTLDYIDVDLNGVVDNVVQNLFQYSAIEFKKRHALILIKHNFMSDFQVLKFLHHRIYQFIGVAPVEVK